MALQGIFYGTTSNQYVKPKIEWTAVQNALENYSDVTAVLTYSRTNTGFKTESTWYGGITINGVRQSGSVFATVTYNSNTEVFRCTQRVYHDGDKDLQVTISADGYFYNTKTQDTTISSTVTIDGIPKAAKVSATDANIGSVATVSITGLTAGYQYYLGVRFGTISGYLDALGNLLSQPVNMTAGSIPFTLPESFYYEIPNSPTGECVLTCVTLLNGQQIGDTQTGSFTITAAKDRCSPAVSGSVEDVNPVTVALTGDSSVIVENASTALCAISSSAKYGATIVEKKIAGISIQEDTLQILSVPTGEIVFRVVDSRGYESKHTVLSETIPYIPLNLNASISRIDPTSGNARLTVNGQCFYGSFGVEENSLRLVWTIDGGSEQSQVLNINEDNTYSASLILSGLAYESEHTVRVWAQDAAGETDAKSLNVGKGIPVFDWGESDFTFHVPVQFKGGISSLADLIYPVGSLYLSTADVNPSIFFGGNWERIQDRFLLAAGQTYSAGSTGGESSHTLTVEELPSHNHGLVYSEDAEGDKDIKWLGTHGSGSNIAYGHTPTGGDQPFNIMPPYLAVYVWKRTS